MARIGRAGQVWQVWRGEDAHGQAGHGRQGRAKPGQARQARRGGVRIAAARFGTAGSARTGHARHGTARPGTAGAAGIGEVGHGETGTARSRPESPDPAAPGTAWLAGNAKARNGSAPLALAGRGRQGVDRQGKDRLMVIDLDTVMATDGTINRRQNIRYPLNGWPDGNDDVQIEVSDIRDWLVQTGWNTDGSGAIWQRYKKADSRDRFSDWTPIRDSPDGPTYLVSAAIMEPGSASLALPDWAPIVFSSVEGSEMEIEDGNIRIGGFEPAAFRLGLDVLHVWGRQIIVGYKIDDGDIVELSRVTIGSAEPTHIVISRAGVEIEGALLSFFISSDFEFSPFTWSGSLSIFTAIPAE